MRIHNHYANQQIVCKTGGHSAAIGHGRSRQTSPEFARALDAPGAKIEVYLVEKRAPHAELHVATYRVSRPIADVHVGQITTRFDGGSWDDQLAVSAAAVQGRPYIHIHNVTNLPLRLNENIVVPPHSILTYTGRHHFGVPLGLYLRDPQNRYRTFRITKPVTDVYYGLVSEELQPLYGGWQNIFDTKVDLFDYYNAYGQTERVQEYPR